MKTFTKISCVSALALAMTIFSAPQARAGGWPIAAGVVGGLAVGTAIGATVASAATPVYYAPPPAVYGAPAPAYAAAPVYAPAYAPVPAPVTAVAAPPYCYAPRVVVRAPYPYYYPYGRVGFGWGPHYYGGRYFRR